MADQEPFEVRQDIVDAEYGSGHAGLGPSGGQVLFDFLFGVLAPIALLAKDPALFAADVADRAVLPPYLAMPTYIVQGCLVAALLLWGITGMRLPVLGMLLAGPFAVGAVLSVVLGAALLQFAMVHGEYLSGWLAFTPWLTAFVFVRHCVLACRAGARRSVLLTIGSLVVTFAAITIAAGSVARARARRASLLESLLLSDSPADIDYACSQITDPDELDMDTIAEAYISMKDDDPRRERLGGVYQRLTGVPIDAAVRRLLPRTGADPQGAAQKPPKKEDDPTTLLVNQLFSSDLEEHKKAAKALISHEPDPKMLEAVVRRYSELREGDPRRAWIEEAYTGLQSDGDTIKAALKRLGKKPAPEPKKSTGPPKHTPPKPPPPSTREMP
ncbi:MAG: hypothetical protein FJ291_13935 [Planctomycetes bacterium]|nr:hypothetical protein [Planctomycetota bacterium]